MSNIFLHRLAIAKTFHQNQSRFFSVTISVIVKWKSKRKQMSTTTRFFSFRVYLLCVKQKKCWGIIFLMSPTRPSVRRRSTAVVQRARTTFLFLSALPVTSSNRLDKAFFPSFFFFFSSEKLKFRQDFSDFLNETKKKKKSSFLRNESDQFCFVSAMPLCITRPHYKLIVRSYILKNKNTLDIWDYALSSLL